MTVNKSRVMGALLGGAIGDAFGAPLEGIRKLSEIKETFGPKGMQEFTPYVSFWDDAEPTGMGIITDDTTMTALTLSGIIEAAHSSSKENFVETMLDTQWQYYLSWGSLQQCGENLVNFIEPTTVTPKYLQPFLFRCGAGKGTIAALSTGERGDLDKPLKYDLVLGGKQVKSPNAGCGGQMRISPIAFLHEQLNVMDVARRNAAITHSHIDAINATGLTATLVENCLKVGNISTALKMTKQEIVKLPQHNGVENAWHRAEQHNKKEVSINIMDKLGRSHYKKNPFLALPVFSQTVYCLSVAAQVKVPTPENFKGIMRLAANHSGDSDSVAAIVGNCVGAAWGQDILPKDWLDILPQKNDLISLGDAWTGVTHKLKLK